MKTHRCSNADLYAAFETDRAERGARDRRLLRLIAEFDKRALWKHDGCLHMGQWLALEYGITVSEGLRRTHAAHAVEELPVIAAALENGSLSLDKVVQLVPLCNPVRRKGARQLRAAKKPQRGSPPRCGGDETTA